MGAVEGKPLPPNMGFDPNVRGGVGLGAGGGLGVVLGRSAGRVGGVRVVGGVDASLGAPKREKGEELGTGVRAAGSVGLGGAPKEKVLGASTRVGATTFS